MEIGKYYVCRQCVGPPVVFVIFADSVLGFFQVRKVKYIATSKKFVHGLRKIRLSKEILDRAARGKVRLAHAHPKGENSVIIPGVRGTETDIFIAMNVEKGPEKIIFKLIESD